MVPWTGFSSRISNARNRGIEARAKDDERKVRDEERKRQIARDQFNDRIKQQKFEQSQKQFGQRQKESGFREEELQYKRELLDTQVEENRIKAEEQNRKEEKNDIFIDRTGMSVARAYATDSSRLFTIFKDDKEEGKKRMSFFTINTLKDIGELKVGGGEVTEAILDSLAQFEPINPTDNNDRQLVLDSVEGQVTDEEKERLLEILDKQDKESIGIINSLYGKRKNENNEWELISVPFVASALGWYNKNNNVKPEDLESFFDGSLLSPVDGETGTPTRDYFLSDSGAIPKTAVWNSLHNVASIIGSIDKDNKAVIDNIVNVVSFTPSLKNITNSEAKQLSSASLSPQGRIFRGYVVKELDKGQRNDLDGGTRLKSAFQALLITDSPSGIKKPTKQAIKEAVNYFHRGFTAKGLEWLGVLHTREALALDPYIKFFYEVFNEHLREISGAAVTEQEFVRALNVWVSQHTTEEGWIEAMQVVFRRVTNKIINSPIPEGLKQLDFGELVYGLQYSEEQLKILALDEKAKKDAPTNNSVLK